MHFSVKIGSEMWYFSNALRQLCTNYSTNCESVYANANYTLKRLWTLNMLYQGIVVGSLVDTHRLGCKGHRFNLIPDYSECHHHTWNLWLRDPKGIIPVSQNM